MPAAPGPAHPERDAAWDRQARDETAAERLDRNWDELLQELRVVQTGVQVLAGFLLTLPFQQRFTRLSTFGHDDYLATVTLAVAATLLLVTPVSLHRILFRRHAKRRMVAAGHRLTQCGLALLALAMTGVVMLVFDVVVGVVAAAVAGTLALLLVLSLWAGLPALMREDPEPG